MVTSCHKFTMMMAMEAEKSQRSPAGTVQLSFPTFDLNALITVTIALGNS